MACELLSIGYTGGRLVSCHGFFLSVLAAVCRRGRARAQIRQEIDRVEQSLKERPITPGSSCKAS